MHQGSIRAMRYFIKSHVKTEEMKRILEIGSLVTEVEKYGTGYREHFLQFNKNWIYEGLDIVAGPGVDIVTTDHYRYPIEDDIYDIVISGQVMEHIPDLCRFIEECARVLKPGGLMCMIAPFNWPIHRYPVDCWRILPDGMRFLLKDIANLEIVEIVTRKTDTMGIARKEMGNGRRRGNWEEKIYQAFQG